MRRLAPLLLAAVFLAGVPVSVQAQEVKSQDLRIKKDERKRWFLIGPKRKRTPPKGYKLLVVLPGGTGTADFHPFIKSIYRMSVDDDFIFAQCVRAKWSEEQAKEIVWPVKADKGRVQGMKFTTETFVSDVIAAVKKKHKIDARHVYVLGWSSGGPPSYCLALEKKSEVTGAFIAMSAFLEKKLPSMKGAKGKPFYLYHSPEDWLKISNSRTAEKKLTKAGAVCKLQTYEGGHGWHGDRFGDIRRGLAWLVEQNESKKRKKRR